MSYINKCSIALCELYLRKCRDKDKNVCASCRTIQDKRNPSDDTVPLLAVKKKDTFSEYF